MNAALIVGVDYYTTLSPLNGCVNDAYSVKSILERNSDGTINFDCQMMTSTGEYNTVTTHDLKDNIKELFSKDTDITLFYFAGHGFLDSSGGYIMSGDSHRGDDGISLSSIIKLANDSPARNRVIILDSCHSGIAGSSDIDSNVSNISEGVTVLTASSKDQYALEANGMGVFTRLLVDALNGSAANLTGDITLGSIYAHIDQSLGIWEQRPVFKTNVKKFVSIRKVTPPISLEHLKLISEYFPDAGFEFKLDPSYEPEMLGRTEGMPDPIKENTEAFLVLQKYNRLNLLIPVDAEHMWNAAMESKSCKLTALGEHYRELVEKGRI